MKNLIAVVTCILFFACSNDKTTVQEATTQTDETTRTYKVKTGMEEYFLAECGFNLDSVTFDFYPKGEPIFLNSFVVDNEIYLEVTRPNAAGYNGVALKKVEMLLEK